MKGAIRSPLEIMPEKEIPNSEHWVKLGVLELAVVLRDLFDNYPIIKLTIEVGKPAKMVCYRTFLDE